MMPATPTTRLPADWALLVIDMQNDFLDRAGYYARREILQRRPDWDELSSAEQRRLLEHGAESASLGMRTKSVEPVVVNICTAIAAARAANRPIAFVHARYGRTFDALPPLLSRDPNRVHFPCEPGTWGADFIGAIADVIGDGVEARERVFEKHTYDAFSNPALTDFLRESKASTVILCGTETQICVLASAQQAALLGFQTYILEDCVWSADARTADAALANFRAAYGGTITVNELG